MEASSALAAGIAQSRAEFAYSAIKMNAQQDKQVADMLQSAQASIPSSPIRGTNVNIKV
jgi:hypothetical protein